MEISGSVCMTTCTTGDFVGRHGIRPLDYTTGCSHHGLVYVHTICRAGHYSIDWHGRITSFAYYCKIVITPLPQELRSHWLYTLEIFFRTAKSVKRPAKTCFRISSLNSVYPLAYFLPLKLNCFATSSASVSP